MFQHDPVQVEVLHQVKPTTGKVGHGAVTHGATAQQQARQRRGACLHGLLPLLRLGCGCCWCSCCWLGAIRSACSAQWCVSSRRQHYCTQTCVRQPPRIGSVDRLLVG